mgnify:CR=1 FL=1
MPKHLSPGTPGQLDALIKGTEMSLNASQTIMQHAANMPPEKREAILRHLHSILAKYMKLSDKVLDAAMENPKLAGRSFLTSMGNNILQILVGFVTLDETKQQHLQASMSAGDREELHKILEQLNGDKLKIASARAELMGELQALKAKQEKGEVIEVEAEVVATE